jgi:hypothetical protein
MDTYEHSKVMKHGTKEHITHLTGKRKSAKTEALKRKMHEKLKKEFNLSDKDIEYGSKNFHA